MRVKVFIVTYNGENHLRENLKSLFGGRDLDQVELNVNVINNHSNFHLDDIFADRVKVYHNDLRPDFSTGHLSRNWNQAIINGFKNLTSPDCDILIHCQDDTIWDHDWLVKLLPIMEKYSFYTSGNGDNVCCYTPEAVKNIGLWDERFCNIGYQEYDYFMRAVIYNGKHSSINDIGDAYRSPWNNAPQICAYPGRDPEKEKNHRDSQQYHPISAKVFETKWGFSGSRRETGDFWNWVDQNVKETASLNYMFYPYFEKDVYNLVDKKYIV
jgi:hypothetical protein